MTCDATAVGSTLRHLLDDDGFRVAIVVALLGAALAWWCAARAAWRVPPPAIVVIAALAGMRAKHELTFSLVLGLALLALAAVVARAGSGRLSALVAAVVGAALLVDARPDVVPGWVAVVMFAAMIPVVPVVELRARRWARLAPVVMLGAVAGVYACVPETDFARPLLGASVVVAFLVLLPDTDTDLAHLGWGVVAGLAVWVGAVGSFERPGGVIGAIGCVAALGWFPAALGAGAQGERPRRSWWVAAATTALLVVWCSRVAGLRESGWLAAFLVAGAFGVAALVVVTTTLTSRRRP
jgi:hypothetical protein